MVVDETWPLPRPRMRSQKIYVETEQSGHTRRSKREEPKIACWKLQRLRCSAWENERYRSAWVQAL